MTTIKKTSRTAETRDKKSRPQPWRPPSALDAPEPPPGYKHRWLRVESLGFDDKKNISSRLREGFELVRAEEYPDFEAPTIDNGKHAGVIGVGGLVLARIPTEIVEQRNKYFAEKTDSQMEAVDNNLFREQHPSMPIHSNRDTRVTFGGGKK
jgi:hypothetical protein|tara:strand:+ start:248 stop:703 length:456 start_codon:yes stop_codon:yes gene_type:complete